MGFRCFDGKWGAQPDGMQCLCSDYRQTVAGAIASCITRVAASLAGFAAGERICRAVARQDTKAESIGYFTAMDIWCRPVI